MDRATTLNRFASSELRRAARDPARLGIRRGSRRSGGRIRDLVGRPQAERLTIGGMAWEEAVRRSLQVKKPAGGWPDTVRKPPNTKRGPNSGPRVSCGPPSRNTRPIRRAGWYAVPCHAPPGRRRSLPPSRGAPRKRQLPDSVPDRGLGRIDFTGGNMAAFLHPLLTMVG